MKKIVIAALLLFAVTVAVSSNSAAKEVKEPLGKWYISSYKPSDNTPAGSYQTSSGARAIPWATCAVDYRDPLVPIGTTIEIEGLGRFKVNDYGGFGGFNGGRRAIDVFINDGDNGFLVERKVYLVREETPLEKTNRELKERREAQSKPFKVLYDPNLFPWQIITDPKIIPSGTVTIQWKMDKFQPLQVLEVADTVKGIGNTVYIGDFHKASLYSEVALTKVLEKEVEYGQVN